MYQFFVAGKKTICVSSFAGKPVKGVAKCDPSDGFDEVYGKQLAQARCDVKVAKKRFQRALKLATEAAEAVRLAQKRHHKMLQYLSDACADVDDALEVLKACKQNRAEDIGDNN